MKVDFITYELFVNCVEKFILNVSNGFKVIEKDFERNAADPFSILFEIPLLELSGIAEWQKRERERQAQKILVQELGNLHQAILGSCEGWRNLGVGDETGADIVNSKLEMIAEIKNKHNTVTGAKLVDVYDDLSQLISPTVSKYHGYTAYFVNILPKSGKVYDKPFQPSDRKTKTKRHANEKIRIIDGKSFYSLVTGDNLALLKVYMSIPSAIERITGFNFSLEDIQAADRIFFNTFRDYQQ